MTDRCNCGASCGENRYHDLGEEGCRHRERELLYARAGLSDNEKQLVRHHKEYVVGYADLAGIFKLPLGTVKSRLSRARAKLKKVSD